ncbi:MAG: uracil-DNA glycosylase [Ktedonobacterales bacterium]|nr:uracil-DNA glycosylase [Ktedonobacterales bacterium]
MEACQRCDLYQGAHRGVAGSGAARAEVLLIGEAPSGYDDRRGAPFSGPSGVFLDELLALAGLDRANVYVTNVVKHRTPEGRSPLPDEIAACAPYLTRQIAAVNPRVIVTLGRFATARFFRGKSISAIHGQAKRIGGRVVVAMYNPAAVLHREELRQTIVEDFARALPAALAEARRLTLPGAETPLDEDAPPQQLTLF